MKLPESLLRFTKKVFVSRENDILGNFFWSFIVVGFFLLPLGINSSAPFFIASIILGFANAFKKRKILDKKDLWFFSFPLLYLILTASLSYTSDLRTGISQLERMIPILCFPIIFLFIKEDKVIVNKIINALFIGIVISFVINLSGALSNSLEIQGGNLIWDASIAGGHSFFESFNHGGSYFIGGNFSKLVHPSYEALYVLVVLVFFYRQKKGVLKITLVAFLFTYLFLLASRGALFLILVLFILYIFEGASLKSRIKRSGLILIFALLLLGLNPRVKTFYERIVDLTTKENYNYTTSEQSRFLIYKSSLGLIKKAPLFGYGIGDADNELLKEYVRLKYLKNSEGRYNAHNQYIQTTLQVGFFGLFFLIGPFIVILFLRKRNIYFLALTIILIGFLFFESMLVRYNGIIFYAIITPMLLRNINSIFNTPSFKKNTLL